MKRRSALLTLFAVAMVAVAITIWAGMPSDGNPPEAGAPTQRAASAPNPLVLPGEGLARTEVGGAGSPAEDGVLVQVRRSGQPVAEAQILLSNAPARVRFFERATDQPATDRFIRSNHGPAAYWSPTHPTAGEPLAVCDENGEAVLDAMAPGVAITARADDGSSETLIVEDWHLIPRAVVFELRRPGVLEVAVVDSAGHEGVEARNECYLHLESLPNAAAEPRFVRVHEQRAAQFSVEGLLERQQITVYSTHGSYAPQFTDVRIAAGRTNCPIELRSVARLVGRVLDAAGQPIAGAEVTGSEDDFILPRPVTCRTDAQGRYGLPFAEGRYILTASRVPDFVTATRGDVEGGSRGVDFHLDRAAGTRVAGQILTSAGRPVADAQVEIWDEGNPFLNGPRGSPRVGDPFLSVSSDGDGRFLFPLVPEGEYSLDVVPRSGGMDGDPDATHPRHRVVEDLQVSATAAVDHLDLRLPAGGRIEFALTREAFDGLVRGRRSTSIPHALLRRVDMESRSLHTVARQELFADEICVFEGVPAGEYIVGTIPESVDSHVELEPEATVRIQGGDPGQPVEGRLYRQGMPLEGCALIVAHITEGSLLRSRSGADGLFILEGVRTGDHILHLRDAAGDVAFAREFLIPGRPKRVDWPEGALTVAVVSHREEAGVLHVDAEVVFGHDFSRRLPAPMRRVRSATIDTSHTIDVQGLCPGRYSMVLEGRDGSVLAQKSVQVDATGVTRAEI